VHGLMGAQIGGTSAYPYVHVWMEPMYVEACSHQLHRRSLSFPLVPNFTMRKSS